MVYDEKELQKFKFFMNLILLKIFTINAKEGIITNNITQKIYYNESNSKTGYIDVTYKFMNKVHHCLAHRLIWWNFYGPVEKGFIIAHKNRIKTDNRIDNLEKREYKDHCHKNIKEGVYKKVFEKRSEIVKEYYNTHTNYNSQFNKEQIKRILELYKSGVSMRKIAELYGTYHQSISDIINKRHYKSILRSIEEKENNDAAI